MSLNHGRAIFAEQEHNKATPITAIENNFFIFICYMN